MGCMANPSTATGVHSSCSVTQNPELTRVAASSGEDAFALQAF